jgi:hypothetical protein
MFSMVKGRVAAVAYEAMRTATLTDAVASFRREPFIAVSSRRATRGA